MKIPDGAGGLVDCRKKIPIWFDPIADAGTPMCRAAAEAGQAIEAWLSQNPDCFPPVVIHITDGESTDGDPQGRIRALTDATSSDGNVLVFNIHLSANPDATPISFLDSPDQLPDEYAKMRFETASVVTPTIRGLAKEFRFKTTDKSRPFVLNADLALPIQAPHIGTPPGTPK